jgi:hypothetical protein
VSHNLSVQHSTHPTEVRNLWPYEKEGGFGSFSNNSRQTRARIADGLGRFSIGLGLAEVIIPGKLAEFIGIEDGDKTKGIMRFYGLHEIAAGVGILSQSQPTGWLWVRVAGDMLDLASLGSTFTSSDNKGRRSLEMARATK